MSEDSCYRQMLAFLQGSYGIRHELFLLLLQVKHTQKRKKFHRINK